MLYCIIELRETFLVIVEQLSICMGNVSGFREASKENENDCIRKLMCTRIIPVKN